MQVYWGLCYSDHLIVISLGNIHIPQPYSRCSPILPPHPCRVQNDWERINIEAGVAVTHSLSPCHTQSEKSFGRRQRWANGEDIPLQSAHRLIGGSDARDLQWIRPQECLDDKPESWLAAWPREYSTYHVYCRIKRANCVKTIEKIQWISNNENEQVVQLSRGARRMQETVRGHVLVVKLNYSHVTWIINNYLAFGVTHYLVDNGSRLYCLWYHF